MSYRSNLRPIVTLLALLVSFVSLGCEDDDSDQRDVNRPATFGDVCSVDAGTCAAPFECIAPAASATSAFCTLECDETADCPAWEATGHCAGPFQSQCESGVCQRQGCR